MLTPRSLPLLLDVTTVSALLFCAKTYSQKQMSATYYNLVCVFAAIFLGFTAVLSLEVWM